MKMYKRTLVTLAMLSMGVGSAQAMEFYIDLGSTGVGTGSSGPDCATCTGQFDQGSFNYDSTTVITLTGPGVSVGDQIVTTNGLDISSTDPVLSGYVDNHISAWLPNVQNYGFNSTAFGATTDQWGISFDMNLTGTIAEVSGNFVTEVAYTDGIINVYLVKYDGADGIASFTNIMDLDVDGSSFSNSSNFVINGLVDFTNTDDFQDMFHAVGTSCAGDDSFEAIAACVPPMEVKWRIDQNLDGAQATINDDGTATISGDHNGSISFAPEPGTLVLLSTALFGMAGISRRRRKI